MTDATDLLCAGCGEPIECCEFCDRPDCREASCFACVQLDIGMMSPEPHEHGG